MTLDALIKIHSLERAAIMDLLPRRQLLQDRIMIHLLELQDIMGPQVSGLQRQLQLNLLGIPLSLWSAPFFVPSSLGV